MVSTYLLCGVLDENRDHLFFRCSYSHEFWASFFGNSTLNPPADFEAIIARLPSSSGNAKVKTICHLLVQALVYVVWKERNTRLHTSANKPPLPLVKEIKGVLKAKLFGLDRATLVQILWCLTILLHLCFIYIAIPLLLLALTLSFSSCIRKQ